MRRLGQVGVDCRGVGVQVFGPLRAPDPEGAAAFFAKTPFGFALDDLTGFFIGEIGVEHADVFTTVDLQRIEKKDKKAHPFNQLECKKLHPKRQSKERQNAK